MEGKSRFGAPPPLQQKASVKPGAIWADMVSKQFILCHHYYTSKVFRNFAEDFTKIFHNVYSRVFIKFLFPKFPDNIFSDCEWHFVSWTTYRLSLAIQLGYRAGSRPNNCLIIPAKKMFQFLRRSNKCRSINEQRTCNILMLSSH